MFFQVPVITQNPHELSENKPLGWISSSSRFAHHSLAGEDSPGLHSKHQDPYFCDGWWNHAFGDITPKPEMALLRAQCWEWMDLSLGVNVNDDDLLPSDILQKQTANMLVSCLMFAQLKPHRSQPLHSPDFLTPSTQYKLGCSPVSYTKPTACANSKI